MLKNYFKIVLRNIQRNKVYSFINIFGLACGMSASLLILLWVTDELKYDNFHQNSEQLYRVMENQHYAGGDIMTTVSTPGPMAPYIKEKYPEIEKAARFTWEDRRLFSYENQSFYQEGRFTDPDFLQMFSFPFIKGDVISALNDPYSIVITQAMS